MAQVMWEFSLATLSSINVWFYLYIERSHAGFTRVGMKKNPPEYAKTEPQR